MLSYMECNQDYIRGKITSDQIHTEYQICILNLNPGKSLIKSN